MTSTQISLRFIQATLAKCITLGFVFVFSIAGEGCERTVVRGDLSVLLIERDYLDSEYTETLARTHSPYNTNQRSKGYDRIRIKREEGRDYVFEVGTFDGVYATLIFNSRGQQVSLKGKPAIPVVTHLEVMGPEEFEVEFDGKVRRFRLVNDVGQFVIRHTVAGLYSDSHGKHYKFTEQGEAVFPNRSFRFVIDTGSAFTRFDTIIEIKPTGEGIKWYGFEIVNDILRLYRVSDNMNYKMDAEPFLVLKKMPLDNGTSGATH